jgi:hypothetical protein
MACEYDSYSVFETFTDHETLNRALKRVAGKTTGLYVNGLRVEGNDRDMNLLKQSYQVEAARAALKKKGFFVSETLDKNTGKIRLTVRA